MRIFLFSLFFAGALQCFAFQVSAATADSCFSCHEQDLFRGKVIHQPVRAGECVQCHNPHVARYEGLLSYEGGKLCFSCHTKEAASFTTGIVHEPINLFECTACHAPHAAEQKGLVDKNIKSSCLRCHSDLPDRFTHTHEPYLNGECSTCHQPHNAKWPMLLTAAKDELCSSCHDSQDLQAAHVNFPGMLRDCLSCHSPHGSDRKGLIRNILHEPFAQGCDSCHSNGSGTVSVNTCNKCHPAVLQQMQSLHNHMARRDGNSCVICHSPHAGDDRHLLRARQKQVCAECHRSSIEKYKNSPYKHGSIDNCSDCHYPHGGNDMAMLKGNGLEVCALCHENQGKFTHPVGPSVPDPRSGRMVTCITCHNPMGTDYPDNLILDGDHKLCVQCHKQY